MTDLQFDFVKTMCGNIEEIFPTLSSDVTLFIACQSSLETAYGTSSLCRLYKNYFGMRNPLSRPSTSNVCGVKEAFWAHYNSCYLSIIDYFLCLSFHKVRAKDLKTITSFMAFLGRWYCPEPSYLNKITDIFYEFKAKKDEKKLVNTIYVKKSKS